ncbi:eukaryotic translation initiation factor 3 subunit D-like [Micractinium conductrix]|uniref:Eukaryotic translation initiation factor 3 subunit D-like n=1 Tax=Micractinium conductrix TaxID=554055 RepID=A0A2P6V515_9CHLO|nr:eukaryotic translation initiation factor 3 subunit D-like [Micractinium conductrix]|eukprot:PSC69167.1 eukaryotic translation initiation factor 3 subunit D-like [Micractinium conductrix]
MPLNFVLPPVEENQEGWGPIAVPPQFEGIPMMPFSKSERLGRIADFGQQAGRGMFAGRYRDREPAPGMSLFNFEKTEEDTEFQMVDKPVVKKPMGGPPRRMQQGGRGWGQPGRAGGRPEEPAGRGGRGGWGQQQSDRGGGAWQQGGRGGWGQQGGRGGWGGRGPMRPWDQPRQTYSSSVDIKPEWQVLGDIITLAALNKLSKQVGEPEELTSAGALAFYDKAADRVTPKNPAKLRKATARTRSSSASEDPIMRRLVAEGAADIFMTDDVMCALMCAPRSQYPWDVVITKTGDALIFDKRMNSSLDFLTNGETAPDPLPEEKDNINGMQLLSMEATGVVSAAGERQALKESAPAGLGPEGTGYKYLKFSLGDSSLIVRCAVDAAIKLGDSVQTVAVHALNEFDPKWSGVDWRQKLENQRGAVLATELKNNANKIAKWTAAALVAGVDQIKLGYISRALPKDNKNHVILGTYAMNLNMDNCWGIVSGLSNLCNDLLETEGKYLLVRDPNKPQLTLYALTSEDAQQYAGEAGAGAAAAADQED